MRATCRLTCRRAERNRGERFLSQFNTDHTANPRLSGVSRGRHPHPVRPSIEHGDGPRTAGMTTATSEAWLPLRVMAAQLGCSLRWLEYRVAEGMPTAVIAGRRKCRPSEVERWLERHGYMRREGSR